MRRISRPIAIAFEKVGLNPDGSPIEATPTKDAPLRAGLGAEAIEKQTGFKLQTVYPGFTEDNGHVTPSLHDGRERLTNEVGESNILPYFFTE